ncbi:hypothetical protein AMECASPLE_039817, partial [Ameca splendens]
SETYGHVYRITFLYYVTVFVTCPEATKEILMSSKYLKDKVVYKRLFNLFGQRFFGNGLITAQDHEMWYKQRRIMDPALRSTSGTLRSTSGTLRSTSGTLKADGKLRVSLTQIIIVFLNLAPLHGLDGWLSSASPGSYVNMTLCSPCPLPSLRTSVDLLRTSNEPSRTMAS